MAQNKKVVWVSGAAGALGQAVMRSWASEARLVALDRQISTAQVESFQAIPVSVDASNAGAVASELAHLDQKGLSPQVWVHCAGGFRFAEVAQTTDTDWDFLYEANLKSSFVLLREILPRMRKAGHGRIVFVSAKGVLNPQAGMGAYCAMKAGLNALIQSAAEEVKGSDVTINAVLPTILDTPANRKAMPEADHSKWVGLAELASVIRALAGEVGRPVHGAFLPVSGRI